MYFNSIRTPYNVIFLLHHVALGTMQNFSVGERLVVVMFDSLGLCHFHISVNFSKTKKKFLPNFQFFIFFLSNLMWKNFWKLMGQDKNLPNFQQVSIESIPSICILSIGLAIKLIFGMRVALLVRIFEPLIHFMSDLLNYSISRTCFYS